MNKKWDKEIRHLAYDFCRGLEADRIIREVKQLPGYKQWSNEQRYNEAWRKLVDVL